MILNFNSILVQSIYVAKTEASKQRKIEVAPRSHHSLSYRLNGDNLLYDENREIISNALTLTFVPEGKQYAHHIVTPSEQIIVHFTTKDPIGSRIECFTLPMHYNIEYLFYSLYNQWEQEQKENDLQCLSIFYNILALIKRNVTRENASKITLLHDSVSYMHAHYREADFNIKKLYERAYVSPAYYRRIFNEIYGCSPIKYLKNLRINYAKQLLLNGYHTVEEISGLAGFGSPAYFSYEFKRMTGYPPSRYLH